MARRRHAARKSGGKGWLLVFPLTLGVLSVMATFRQPSAEQPRTHPLLLTCPICGPKISAQFMGAAHDQYAFGRSPQEYARLARQAEIMIPMTLRLFSEAGIRSGMNVLDLGSGAGT